VIHLGYVVGASQAHTVDHDIGYGPSSSRLEQLVLQGRALRVNIEFDNVRLRSDGVLFNQNGLGSFRVGTVGLGEDDDCRMISRLSLLFSA
jgi:hypothetical protein